MPLVPVLGSLGAIGIGLVSILGIVRRPADYGQVWIKLTVHLAVMVVLIAIGAAGPFAFATLAAVVAWIGWSELLRALETRYGPIVFKPTLCALGAALPLVPLVVGARPLAFSVAVLALAGVAVAWIAMAAPILSTRRPPPLHGLLAATFGASIVSFPLGLLVVLDGRAYGLFAFLVMVVASHDGFAEGTGRLIGRGSLWPAISPAKTLGGTLGAVAGAMLVAAFLGFLVPWSLPLRLAIAAGTIALAIVGDLLASSIKRETAIKDFGSLLPAHGGLLDRFDSLLFAAPAFLIAAWWLGGLA